MTPHLMSSIHDSQGALVQTYTPKAESTVAAAQAAQQVTSLMQGVVATGTASGVGFPSYLCAVVKDGNCADRQGNRADRYLDDRLRPGQQPPGCSGRRRAPAGHSSDAQCGGAHHERRAQGRRAPVVGPAALQRPARPHVELRLEP